MANSVTADRAMRLRRDIGLFFSTLKVVRRSLRAPRFENTKEITVRPVSKDVRRALIVLDNGFLQIKSGSKQVLEAQISALQSNGCAVDFMLTYPVRFPRRKEPDQTALHQLGVEKAYEAGLDIELRNLFRALPWMRPSSVPGIRSMSELIEASRLMKPSNAFWAESAARSYDVVLTNYVWNLPLAIRVAQGSPVLVETHDVQSRQIAFWRGSQVLERNLRVELRELAQADVIIALNRNEAEFFENEIPGARVELLFPPARAKRRNADVESTPKVTLAALKPTDKADVSPDTGLRLDAIFIGSRHDPNRRGIEWFVREILPLIRRDIEDFQVGIVGPVVDVIKERGDKQVLSAPGVLPIGIVADIAPLYEAARIVIVPLREGEGISIKTIEAMGHGKAIVTTSVGLRGFPLEASYPSDDDTHSFAQRIVGFLKDDALRKRAENLSYGIYEKHFTEQAYIERFGDILRSLQPELIGSPADVS